MLPSVLRKATHMQQLARPRLRRAALGRAVAALCLTAPVGATAAGGGDSDSPAEGSTSAGASADSGSAADGSGSDSGEAQELTAETFYPTVSRAQADAGSFTFTMDVDSGGRAMTADGEIEISDPGKPAAGHMSMDLGGAQLETLSVEGISYVKGTGMFDTGGKWFMIDPKTATGVWAAMGEQRTPADYIAVMKDPETFEVAGHEEVDGVDTVHYRIGVSREAYAQLVSGEMGQAAAKLLPKVVPMEMWVDADGLPRKQRIAITMDVSGTKQKVDTEATFSDYGEDVDIEAPSADEITTKDPLATP